MKKPRMHIKPTNYISSLRDNIAENILFTLPEGPKLINETSDYIVEKDGLMYYHEHPFGYEVFIIDKGSVACCICGKRAIAHEGDFVLIPPHVPHGFVYLEEGTIWRELFQGIDMYQIMLDQDTVRKNAPEKAEDEEFMNKLRLERGIINLPEPDPVEDVDKKDLSAFIKPKEWALKSYKYDGITLNLKIGRWELDGVKEIWEYVLDKDMVIDWTEPHGFTDLFVVKKGSVKVEVAGEKSFIAKARDIINIPNYTLHKFTVLEAGTVLHDYNCQAHLFRFLGDIERFKKNDPRKLDDPKFIEKLKDKHGLVVTGVYKK
jgi:gentisate 1,2-dioxygenase